MSRWAKKAGRTYWITTKLILLTLVEMAALCALPGALRAQTATPEPSPYESRANQMLRGMTPAQKVGQLFVVSYIGNDPVVWGDMNDLLLNYKIGGVQLRSANQNFVNNSDTPRQIGEITNRLQATSAAGSFSDLNPYLQATQSTTHPLRTQDILPLFVMVSQEGDGAPNSEITQGLTPLPNQLTLGATFKPERAEAMGRILGNELERMGINVLLGPVLDVAEQPRPGALGDEGARVFGGDPFWVGQMAAAFTGGVRNGSTNRVAVVPRNFPGLGSADRNIEEEIPTVQKSLDQLRQIDLAPFFFVLGPEAKPNTARADGLLMTHIRYRGFQGNIRANTRPVSLDPQAFDALMKLPEVAAWRAGGGIIFSDQLGLRSVRRYDDPTERSFNARKVAQDAFLAGNDVLLLGNFALSNAWSDQLANIKDTVNLFRDQYVKDAQFAARVDGAVTRILALKLRLYNNNLALGNVLANLDRATNTGKYEEAAARAVTEAVNATSKDAITLLSPSVRELPSLLPQPPGKNDSIVFITDDRTVQECARCAPYPAIRKNALQDIALNLYGPRTTGQLTPARISSFTFGELADALRVLTPTTALTSTTEAATPTSSITPTVIESSTSLTRTRQIIESANWIIISMIDLNPQVRSARTLKEFLAARGDTLRDKRVIVFGMGPPYFLDATEVSKITAYYGVYSRTPASLEAAIRVLFGEFQAPGASPVSIGSLNYLISQQTTPNPAQVIRLQTMHEPKTVGATLTPTVQLRATPTLTNTIVRAPNPRIGDRLRLSAGPILDRNGRIVPDGTPVQFLVSFPAERIDQNLSAPTRNGIAEILFPIERKGKLEIRVESNEARDSDRVNVTVDEVTGSIETVRPTAIPSPQPLPTSTMPRPTDPPTLVPAATMPSSPKPIAANGSSFFLTLTLMIFMSALSLSLLSGSHRLTLSLRWRSVMWSWLGGWLAYSGVALGLPGTRALVNVLNWGAAVALALVTAIIVLLFAILRRLALSTEKG